MSQAHRNSGAGHMLRTILKAVDDSGPQQFVEVTGVEGQVIGQAVRSQHFGLSTYPPANAEGLALLLGGGMDRAHILGLEHPQWRPTGLPIGATRLYDASTSNYVDIRNGVLTVKHATQITLQVGGCSLTITSSGVAINGGTITNDGHAVDKTHKHVDAGGAGLSGVPQ